MDITNNITNFFLGKNSLISTTIEGIRLEKDEFDELQIEIIIGKFSKKSKYSKVRLLFNEIIEFQFYYNSNYSFYNIENYKLLYFEDTIYLSFDPDESVQYKSINDSDFILAKSVKIL